MFVDQSEQKLLNFLIQKHSMSSHCKYKHFLRPRRRTDVWMTTSVRETPAGEEILSIILRWEFKGLDKDRTQVRTMVGMDWVSKPFMIATFIENDISGAQEKAAKIFKKIFPVE